MGVSQPKRRQRIYVLISAVIAAGLLACDRPAKELAGPDLQTQLQLPTEDQPFYYYDKQPVPLEVDPTRLVLTSSQPVIAIARQLLGRHVQVETEEDLADRGEPGHRLLGFSAGTSRRAAAQARAVLKADNRFAFVSNVYRGVASQAEFIPLNRLIVRFKDGVTRSQIDSLNTALGTSIIREPQPDSGWSVYFLKYPARSTSTPLEVAAQYDQHPLVAWADPDRFDGYRLHGSPTDPYYSFQYHLKNSSTRFGIPVDINAEPAWDLTKGSSSVVVTVIDDGIETLHPDFDGMGLGYDPYWTGRLDNAWSPYADDSHGTHVAGTLAGTHDNSEGIAGVAPNILLTSVRIFRNGFSAPPSAIGDGINFAWRQLGAAVIINSWGGGNPSNYIEQAIMNAVLAGRDGKGTVVVCSAGNTSDRAIGRIGDVHWPASHPVTIAAGAINRHGYLTNYTPEGSELDIVAPSSHFSDKCVGDAVSVDLLGSDGCNDGPNNDIDYTGTWGGTSHAAPQVAGAAALLLTLEPNLTELLVRSRLFSTADYWGPDNQYGKGKLNVYAALYHPQPSLDVTINGPIEVRPNVFCSWFATVSGGSGPYTYDWYKSGIPVGGNSAYVTLYTDISSFRLRVDVTEPSTGAFGTHQIMVTNTPSAMQCFT